MKKDERERLVERHRAYLSHWFLKQIDDRMEALGMTHREFARVLGRSEAYVSKVFSDPSNLTLRSLVEWSMAVGLQPTVVAYENPTSDLTFHVDPTAFLAAWHGAGCPLTEEQAIARRPTFGLQPRAAATSRWKQSGFVRPVESGDDSCCEMVA